MLTLNFKRYEDQLFDIVTFVYWNIVYIESCMYKSVLGKINKLQKSKLCRLLVIFHVIFIYRAPPPHPPPPNKSKYQSWYLTPCFGLEVQNPIQALKSVKGLGNTLDLNSKWEWTSPSFGNFSWDIYRVPPKKLQISKLIFEILLWAWGAEAHPGT